MSGIVLLFAVLLAGIVGLGVLGVRDGLQERERRLQKVAQARYERALALAEAGDAELALVELGEAIRIYPQFSTASERAEQIRQQLSAQPTVTIPPEYDTAEGLFRSAQTAETAGKPDEAIGLLQDLRDLYPQHRQEEVNAMLYSLAYRRGQELVAAGDLAEAVGRFEDALTARPDDPEALAQKRLASMYLSADRNNSQAGWDEAIVNWEALYKLDAGYRDVDRRLAQAYAGKGDALANKQQWCAAQATYERGIEVDPNAPILVKLDLAREHCLATPVAAAPTPRAVKTPSQSGRFAGQITGTVDIWGDRIQIRGRVLDRNGRAVAGAAVRISAFNWSATATTGGDGNYSFDGLRNPVVYTLVLTSLPSEPIEVPTEWGKQQVVNFVEH